MDYSYLGEAYRWGPDQVDQLGWSSRKVIIESHRSAMREIKNKHGSK